MRAVNYWELKLTWAPIYNFNLFQIIGQQKSKEKYWLFGLMSIIFQQDKDMRKNLAEKSFPLQTQATNNCLK